MLGGVYLGSLGTPYTQVAQVMPRKLALSFDLSSPPVIELHTLYWSPAWEHLPNDDLLTAIFPVS